MLSGRRYGDWNSLTTATKGKDYTIEYLTEGDLAGYTLLTVTAIKPGPGDANGDDQVDGSDATLLATYWQTGTDTTNTTVPEPGCMVLLLTLLAVGLGVVSRKRR